MDKPLIKICGLCDPTLAYQAAKAGAKWIGIVFHPASKRFVHPENALAITEAVFAGGATPVGVFVDQNATEMQAICERNRIETVQLHGEIAQDSHPHLPAHYNRIYVINNTQIDLQGLNNQRDYLLIDNPEPGSGLTLDWTALHYDLPFPWILAGGLTPNNVTAAISVLHPDGVDVSSGVEKAPGIKDRDLIEQFIQAIKESS